MFIRKKTYKEMVELIEKQKQKIEEQREINYQIKLERNNLRGLVEVMERRENERCIKENIQIPC